MKILIAYATRHGSSEKVSQILENKLLGKVTLHNLKKRELPDISNFDAIIIGGSIHAGQIQQKVKLFIQKNENALSKVHLGLYLCCMDKEKAPLQFENAYPESLREKAVTTGLFGGEFILERMNWFERLVVKKITGVKKSVSEIDEEAISRFAEKFNILPQ